MNFKQQEAKKIYIIIYYGELTEVYDQSKYTPVPSGATPSVFGAAFTDGYPVMVKLSSSGSVSNLSVRNKTITATSDSNGIFVSGNELQELDKPDSAITDNTNNNWKFNMEYGDQKSLKIKHISKEKSMAADKQQTFALETYANRAFNYLDRMVDKNNLPYFNIFWENPAEAAHDWPDFGDVMTRALQGAVMARHMTGRESINEKIWLKKAQEYIDPETGLLTRPETNFSNPGADLGDYALTLYALVTVYDDSKDPAIADVIKKMVDGFHCMKNLNPGIISFVIKSLMAVVRSLGYMPALEIAKECVIQATETNPIIQEDNTYPIGGHMHTFTRGLVGIADYALYTNDPVLFSRVDAAYRYVKSLDPGFGFIPEVVDRQGDIIACETCSLMDYIGIGVTLANNGHPEYWGDIERLTRNHLAESQAVDNSWLISDNTIPDTEQFSHRDIGDRMLGGYAGWSSPTHFLAVKENLHWGGDELRGKTRAFQNCCGGSGTHAYYIAWKNVSRFYDGILQVNMHIDKLLPQAEIRCYQPYKGLLTIELKQDCDVKIRIPDFVSSTDLVLTINGQPVEFAVSGNFLRVNERHAKDRIELNYMLPKKTERVTIGNKKTSEKSKIWYPLLEQTKDKIEGAFSQYTYDVTWIGDTVINITPVGDMPTEGYSDFDQKTVEVYYGEDGPGRLYQREYMKEGVEPKLAELHEDTSPIDYWWLK